MLANKQLMTKLVYPELSYLIIGIAYKIYNDLGYGYQEKYYQKAFEIEFRKQNICYKREVCIHLEYSGEKIGKYFIDFIIENKIVIELKIGGKFYQRDIKQILSYLESKKLKLGIIILISPSGIRYNRIINNKI